ncbi:alginate export family protein [Simiduia agarivorans]|uniref:Alginate export domain-containing protein n=1 Tax=Simiduia agarivorans (strain DSM 21679 / JCM 13881 / BCRC 17597 / SA1) TaxID=1117647 RepID=K4KPZ3_SIMAS|nr:alginate export family protein [Simiduia agarivorans]AFV00169.1 hypothetical protein M5M_15180 [Simiduia agarivorans SA1 = DSM 21679]
MKKLYLPLAIAAACTGTVAHADSTFETLVKDGTANVDLRYRYEGVEEDGKAEDANANTLRTRLSLTTGTVGGVSFGLEFDDVRHLTTDFNSTSNGKTDYPVVADPRGTDLNQAYAKYSAGGFTATGGRQRIVLDDQRFVGGVAWRQNEQTYDGARLQFGQDAFSAEYSYVSQVNRIFGPSGAGATLRGDVHLANGGWKISDAHKLTGFFYSMDFDDAAALNNQTLGLRYQGKFGPVGLTGSYATQSETGDAPVDYSTDYLLLEASGDFNVVTATVGAEILGSDGGVKGFQTPLATGHKFQGFADKFLGTPANGVQDLYAGVSGKAGPVALSLTYHDFQAVEGSASYGTEWDFTAAYAINKQVKTLLKFADYSADDFSSDTQKIWLQVQITL